MLASRVLGYRRIGGYAIETQERPPLFGNRPAGSARALRGEPYLAPGTEARGRFREGPGMPVDFLTGEQQRRYGRYAGEPSPAQLGRYFHLDDADHGLIARCRGDHNRLGFAVQLGTVRFLGTFLPDLTEVPPGVVAHLGRQLGIADATGLRRYAAGEKRWDHAAEIRRRYGYRDFHEGSAAAALTRWLANRAWVSAERPSVLFDLATARLVERKVLLPGVTVLARLVAQVRDQAASRLWRTLARTLKPRQAARLETLLIADEHSRQSPLERLRRAPTRVSVAGMVEALKQLQEIRALGVSHIDLSTVPPVRVQVLARYAALARAQAIARMPPPRRRATLLAFAKVQETAALDDVVDLLDQLITAMLSRVEHAGQRRRLRTLKDLDSAALLLHEACRVLLDPACSDHRVRDTVFARVPREQLVSAVAQVADLVGPLDDHYFEDLRTRYSHVRRFLPALLESVEFATTDAGHPTIEAFDFLKAIEGQKRPDMSQAPQDLLTPAWKRVVIGSEHPVDRRFYTFLCPGTAPGRSPPPRSVRTRQPPLGRPAGQATSRAGLGEGAVAHLPNSGTVAHGSPRTGEPRQATRRSVPAGGKQPADQFRRDDRAGRPPRRPETHAAGQAGRARQSGRPPRGRARAATPRGPDRGPPGGPGLDGLRHGIPPCQRGRRPGRRPRPEPLRRAPGRGVQRRAGAPGPPRHPRADPRPAVLGPAELHPRRDHHQGERPAGRLPGPHPPGAGVGRGRGRFGRRAALRRPSAYPQRRPEPEVLQHRPRRHLLQLHQQPVHRHPRHRRAGHDPRLPVHPGGPAGAADQPSPSRSHERHGRLQRPGVRPVLAAGLPVQPAAGRLRRGPLLADGPKGRLRCAQRPGPPADQHPADRAELGRPATS